LERHCLAGMAKAGIARARGVVQGNIVSVVGVERNSIFLHFHDVGAERRRSNVHLIDS
jgi:hypothetical protein